jgi:hypothetical protein
MIIFKSVLTTFEATLIFESSSKNLFEPKTKRQSTYLTKF